MVESLLFTVFLKTIVSRFGLDCQAKCLITGNRGNFYTEVCGEITKIYEKHSTTNTLAQLIDHLFVNTFYV